MAPTLASSLRQFCAAGLIGLLHSTTLAQVYTDAMLKQHVDELTKKLPRKLDEVTNLTAAVVLKDRRIQYTLAFTSENFWTYGAKAQGVTPDELRESLSKRFGGPIPAIQRVMDLGRPSKIKEVCSDAELRAMINDGVELIWQMVVDSTKLELLTIQKPDCQGG